MSDPQTNPTDVDPGAITKHSRIPERLIGINLLTGPFSREMENRTRCIGQCARS